MALGVRSTQDAVILTGWDAAELQKFTLEDGTTYAAVVAQLNAALAGLNAELLNDPRWSAAVSYQDEPQLEYRVGSSNGFGVFTEYTLPDAQRAKMEGHMLPLIPYDRMLGWTWRYLQKARLVQVQNDIADAIKDARDRYRLSILGRVLKRGDDSGAANGLGSSGYSPGFATAAANTSVDFDPPDNEGTSFDTNHEHYVGTAGGAFTNAIFEDWADELKEHGHRPPFNAWIGPSDEAAVKDLTEFTAVADQLVRVGSAQDVALLQSDRYIGTIHGFAVEVVRGMPQYYGFGFKSYGPNSQRNALRVRLAKGESVPRVVAMQDPRAGNGTSPLQNIMLFLEFGVGVGDRTAGSTQYNNNATWADGTAT